MKKTILIIILIITSASYSQNYIELSVDNRSCEICTCGQCNGTGTREIYRFIPCYNCKNWASSYRDIKGCDVCKNNKGKYGYVKENCNACDGKGKWRNTYNLKENIEAREEQKKIAKRNSAISEAKRKREEIEGIERYEKFVKEMSDPVSIKRAKDQIEKEKRDEADEADRIAKERADRKEEFKANRNPVFVNMVKYATKEVTKSKYELNFKKPLTLDFINRVISDRDKLFIGISKLRTIDYIKVKCKECGEEMHAGYSYSGGNSNDPYSIKISGDGGTTTLDKMDGERFQYAIDNFFKGLVRELESFGQ